MSQSDEKSTSIFRIMTDPAFQAGLEDVRSGRPARFDQFRGYDYERGRQFGYLIPAAMPLRTKRKKVNGPAVRLLWDAFNRGDIL